MSAPDPVANLRRYMEQGLSWELLRDASLLLAYVERLEAERDRLREALVKIGRRNGDPGACAEFSIPEDKWCPGCIAREALGEKP